MTVTTSETTDAAPPGSALPAGLIEYRMPCAKCWGRGQTTHVLPSGWESIRDRMVDAGRRRAANTPSRREITTSEELERANAARQALEQSYRDIREVWQEARGLGINQDVCIEWANLSRAHFGNIVTGKVGPGR